MFTFGNGTMKQNGIIIATATCRLCCKSVCDPCAMHFGLRSSHFGPIKVLNFPMFDFDWAKGFIDRKLGGSWHASAVEDLDAVSPDLGAVSPDLGAVSPDLGAVSPDLGAASPDLGAVRPDLGAVRPDLGAARPDLGAVRPVAPVIENKTNVKYEFFDCGRSDSMETIYAATKAANHAGREMTLSILGITRIFVCVVPGNEVRGKYFRDEDKSILYPRIHRILDVSLISDGKSFMSSFTFVGPPDMKPGDSVYILLRIWLSECKKSMFYILKNVDTNAISMTKITPEKNGEMRYWIAFLHRPIPSTNEELFEEYREFARSGKRGLLDYLGVRVSDRDLPTWLDDDGDELIPGQTTLQFVVCDRGAEDVISWDLSQLKIQIYSEGWLYGKKAVAIGHNVGIKNYLRSVNRFRVVALLSRPHTGTWDDKVEYAIIDLTEKIGDGVHRVYIIKAADVVYLPQLEKLPGEDAMIRSAMDNYVNIILSSDYSVRANKSTQNAYPPKGVYSPVKSVAAALDESPSPSINSKTVVETDSGTSNDRHLTAVTAMHPILHLGEGKKGNAGKPHQWGTRRKGKCRRKNERLMNL